MLCNFHSIINVKGAVNLRLDIRHKEYNAMLHSLHLLHVIVQLTAVLLSSVVSSPPPYHTPPVVSQVLGNKEN